MTQDLLTDLGEEYLIKNGFDAITVTVGLYLDDPGTGGDDLSDTDDLSAITTEPTNTNYSTATATFTAADLSGNWGVDNDSQFSFDFSDQTSSQDVDTAYIEFSFQADDTNDGSATDHLIANPALSQTRDIGSIDTLNVGVGDLKITVD